jgi:hypothetical protein
MLFRADPSQPIIEPHILETIKQLQTQEKRSWKGIDAS